MSQCNDIHRFRAERRGIRSVMAAFAAGLVAVSLCGAMAVTASPAWAHHPCKHKCAQ